MTEQERIRLIVDTDHVVRRAVKLRAVRQGEQVTISDVVNAILRDALAEEIAEIEQLPPQGGTGKRPGRKPKKGD